MDETSWLQAYGAILGRHDPNGLAVFGASAVHKDGQDSIVTLDVLSINGCIVLREPKDGDPEKS